jgi:hypothetical protein
MAQSLLLTDFERKTSPSDHRLTENDLQPCRTAYGPATTAACTSCGKSSMPGEMQANERVGRKRLQQEQKEEQDDRKQF